MTVSYTHLDVYKRQAVVREVEEELNITPKIIRPLWLNQSFFTEDVDKLNYHEICIYYLMRGV